MKIILGIGNPGNKYDKTRHNVGFMILDKLAEELKEDFRPGKGDYYFVGSSLGASQFLLIKPTTYVNLSGIAAKELIEEYNVNLKDFIVVTDDINLETGNIRIRKKGGDGGHNGISSIIYHLVSNQFPRLRFGVGNSFEDGAMANYVLSRFSADEEEIIEESLNFSTSLLKDFIFGGYDEMLDNYSRNSTKKLSPKN